MKTRHHLLIPLNGFQRNAPIGAVMFCGMCIRAGIYCSCLNAAPQGTSTWICLITSRLLNNGSSLIIASTNRGVTKQAGERFCLNRNLKLTAKKNPISWASAAQTERSGFTEELCLRPAHLCQRFLLSNIRFSFVHVQNIVFLFPLID